MKKAIIYHCVDNFNNRYKVVQVGEEADVPKLIEACKSRSTEIERVEICRYEEPNFLK